MGFPRSRGRAFRFVARHRVDGRGPGSARHGGCCEDCQALRSCSVNPSLALTFEDAMHFRRTVVHFTASLTFLACTPFSTETPGNPDGGSSATGGSGGAGGSGPYTGGSGG